MAAEKDPVEGKHEIDVPYQSSMIILPSSTQQHDTEKSSHKNPVEPAGGEVPLLTVEIPNGDLISWLHVAGSWCIFVNTWGIINTYGVYQTFYQTNLLRFESESTISWIGSVQAALLYVVGAAAGPIFDAGYMRALIWSGVILSVLGMMLASIAKTYWQVILSQGVLVGFGTGCLFVGAVSIIPQYFTTKKIFAYGITSTGSSIGGVIFPIISSRIQLRLDSGWATRIIAFVMLALFIVPLAVMKQRIQPATRRKLYNANSFRDKPFLVFCLGTFFGFMGIYVPFYYVQLYALEICHMNENFSFYLLAIINGSSTIGRIVPNFYADKTGPLNMQIPFTFIAAILCFCWIAVKNTAGLVVWCVVYGFFCGCFASMPSSSVMSLTNDLQTMGSRMGMALGASGLGFLVGSPIGGALLQSRGSWASLQVWVGALLVISGLCSIAARIMRVGTKFKVKV
ncbi:uncharacterized protein EAE98_005104 [Botrytis deweyae]|uniref:Major facilitator superfamily (MFS) profile domain-containing protein n=1 Tax=Botrytis deweyae TaxID=2478750 RepID=A0ABQ7IMW2_9HELO|nr:uncharacterized protein EAE98_005104 [Botrytis deweyae]KAF7929185.1 hypothetical protein EAE98_005104 [Botrytis deweyae]